MTSDRFTLGKTVCASCRQGKLASAEMWEGTARCWYCVECGHVNRWTRIPEHEQAKRFLASGSNPPHIFSVGGKAYVRSETGWQALSREQYRRVRAEKFWGAGQSEG